MQLVSNICLPLVVVVLALQWHSSPLQALNNIIGNHPDCGQQPGDPDSEPSQSDQSTDEFPGFGGRYTTPFKYPWVARVSAQYFQYVTSDNGTRVRARHIKSCTASILNERWALTAGHCLYTSKDTGYKPIPVRSFHFLTGRYDLDRREAELDTEQQRALEMAIPHPEYVPRMKDFDVALLKLSGPGLRLGPAYKVGAICLPTTEGSRANIDKATLGFRLTVLGWGYKPETTITTDGTNDIHCPLKQRKLRETTSHVWSHEACKAAIKRYWERNWLTRMNSNNSDNKPHKLVIIPSLEQRTKRSICWGVKGMASMCRGDSGGPMVAFDQDSGRWVQYGVNSWNHRVTNKTSQDSDHDWFPSPASGGMRVSQFTGWIWETVNQYSTESDGINIATATAAIESNNEERKPCEPVPGNFTRNNSLIRPFNRLALLSCVGFLRK